MTGFDQSDGSYSFTIDGLGNDSVTETSWMSLAEAVRWTAHRGNEPERPFRSTPRDGPRIGGDESVEEVSAFKKAADAVRAALSRGAIDAWGVKEGGAPERIPTVWWSGLPGAPPVSWTEFYHPFAMIWVDSAKVTALWPAEGDPNVNAASRIRLYGRPRELDHDDLKRRAAAYRKDKPGISRASAAESIVSELEVETGRRRDKRGIEKIIGPLWN